MSALWLQEMKWPDVADYLKEDDRVMIPVGSTEQHGKYDPLGTDSLAAICLAEDASDKARVVLAPPLWFGWSPHHLIQPGTINIRAEVLIEVLYDIMKSLAENGFKKFVVINGHRWANVPWIQIASERAQRELKVKVAIFDPGYMSKQIASRFGPLGHADDTETSHMLYKYPHLVDMSQAKDYLPEEKPFPSIPREEPFLRDTLCMVLRTKEDMKARVDASQDSISGKPSLSSANKGKEYHEYLVSRLIQVLEQL